MWVKFPFPLPPRSYTNGNNKYIIFQVNLILLVGHHIVFPPFRTTAIGYI